MGNSGQEGYVVSSELGPGDGQESGATPSGDPASSAKDPDISRASLGMAFAASAGPPPTADQVDPWPSLETADPGAVETPPEGTDPGSVWAPSASENLVSSWSSPAAADADGPDLPSADTDPGSAWAPPDAAGPGSPWAPPAASGPGSPWGYPAGQPAPGYPAGPQPGAQPPAA